jgi:hypothetical protein
MNSSHTSTTLEPNRWRNGNYGSLVISIFPDCRILNFRLSWRAKKIFVSTPFLYLSEVNVITDGKSNTKGPLGGSTEVKELNSVLRGLQMSGRIWAYKVVENDLSLLGTCTMPSSKKKTPVCNYTIRLHILLLGIRKRTVFYKYETKH